MPSLLSEDLKKYFNNLLLQNQSLILVSSPKAWFYSLSPGDCYLGNLERKREVRRDTSLNQYIPCCIAWTGEESRTERAKENLIWILISASFMLWKKGPSEWKEKYWNLHFPFPIHWCTAACLQSQLAKPLWLINILFTSNQIVAQAKLEGFFPPFQFIGAFKESLWIFLKNFFFLIKKTLDFKLDKVISLLGLPQYQDYTALQNLYCEFSRQIFIK